MNRNGARGVLLYFALCAALTTQLPGQGRAAAADASSEQPVSAFLLTSAPNDYSMLEKLFASLKDGGANTVIVGPARPAVLPDMDLLPNLVYLAHQAGLKIFFILPVRDLPQALTEHPDWWEMRYDLASGTIQPAARLNLFHPDAENYVVQTIKEIASYSVDGILLGPDFFYDDTEGMSPPAMEEYKTRYNAALVPGRAIARVGSGERGPAALEYGEGHREWAEMKRDRLAGTLKNIAAACRAVNPGVVFGVPLHADGLSGPDQALSKYAFDANAFGTAGASVFWIAIPHRDLRAARGLSYKKGMETLSQTAQAAAATGREAGKTIIVLQTSASGKVLPFSEIEEADSLAKKSGEAWIAYMIGPDALLPASLTKKMFRREASVK